MNGFIEWGAGILTTQGVEIGVGLLVTAVGFYYNQMIVSPVSRQRLAAALDAGSPMARYREMLGGALDWVDRRLARDWETEAPTDRARPFSARLFEFSLTLALLYPAALLLALWAVKASAARIGENLEVVGEVSDENDLMRVAVLLALTITLVLSILARSKRQAAQREWTEFIWLSIAVLVVTTGAFAVVSANATDGAPATRGLLTTPVIAAIAGAVTLAAAGALRGATALAVALLAAAASVLAWDIATCTPTGGGSLWESYNCQTPAPGQEIELFLRGLGERLGLGVKGLWKLGLAPIAFVGAVLGALLLFGIFAPSMRGERPFWIKGAVLRAFAFMFGSGLGAALGSALTGNVPSLVVVLGFGFTMFCVVIVAQMASGVTRAVSDAIRSPTISFLIFSGYLAAVCLGFAMLVRQDAVDDNLRMYFVMFAFFPTLNVAFDFLTAGVTRWTLRRGLASGKGFPFLWTLVDIVVASLLFLLLGVAMVVAAHVASVFDVDAVLADVRGGAESGVGDYWWLVIAMLSTLAPTIIHLALAIFSIVLFFWNGVSGRVARLVRAGGDDGAARAIASILLTAFSILAFVTPVVLMAALIFFVAPQATGVGDAYIGMLQQVSAYMSALYEF